MRILYDLKYLSNEDGIKYPLQVVGDNRALFYFCLDDLFNILNMPFPNSPDGSRIISSFKHKIYKWNEITSFVMKNKFPANKLFVDEYGVVELIGLCHFQNVAIDLEKRIKNFINKNTLLLQQKSNVRNTPNFYLCQSGSL